MAKQKRYERGYSYQDEVNERYEGTKSTGATASSVRADDSRGFGGMTEGLMELMGGGKGFGTSAGRRAAEHLGIGTKGMSDEEILDNLF